MKTISCRLLTFATLTLAAPTLVQATEREYRSNTTEGGEKEITTATVAGESDDNKPRLRSYLEEIIVTAQKREERLQDVPISITALTEDILKRTGADKFEDYIGEMPGAFYHNAGQGRSRINMRGLQTSSSAGFEEGQSAVAIYIDDLPSLATSNPWATTDLRLYDIERVEVLRGPQGTLFGSGSLGGALRILTNKPNLQEFDASVEAGLETTQGGDESWRLDSMINLPIVRDKFAFRAVGYYRDDGGWVDNTFRNEKDVNGNESRGGRALFTYAPTQDLSFRLTITHQDDHSDDKNAVNLSHSPPYDYGNWTPAFTDVRLTSYNLTAEYDFGPAIVTSSTTYADSYSNLGQGLGLPFQVFFNWRTSPDATFGEDNIFTAKTLAQELRLTSQNPGRLQWVVGAFYMDQDLGQKQHWFASTVWGVTGSTTLGAWSVPANSKQKALFGELSFGITDTITAVAGARLFDYSFERHTASAQGILGTAPPYPSPVKEIDDDGVTPKFALRYKPNDTIMTYVQASKGFRLGQTNTLGGVVDPGNGYVFPTGSKSDRLWNYELGVKSLLLDNRLKLNAAIFYIDWKDIQLLRGNPLPNSVILQGFNDNAGHAVSKGAELEFEYVPTDHLTLGTSHSFVDAQLKSVLPGTVYSPGDRLPGTPEYWSSNYIQLADAGLIGQADGYVRLSHRYVGRVISDMNNDSANAAESDSYNMFDFRAGLALGKYEMVLHVDNVTDEDAATTRSRTPNPTVAAQTGGGFLYRLRPRTVGLTFRAQF